MANRSRHVRMERQRAVRNEDMIACAFGFAVFRPDWLVIVLDYFLSRRVTTVSVVSKCRLRKLQWV